MDREVAKRLGVRQSSAALTTPIPTTTCEPLPEVDLIKTFEAHRWSNL
jgi:hypothetical protein